jgi:hypothetical protein
VWLGDEQTIENEILAFEPPTNDRVPHPQDPGELSVHGGWKRTWTVVTLTPVDTGHTHMRAASLGYGTDPESIAMRQFLRAREPADDGRAERTFRAPAPAADARRSLATYPRAPVLIFGMSWNDRVAAQLA